MYTCPNPRVLFCAGETRTAHDDDLATDTLVEDALAVVHALHARRAQPVVLVGHRCAAVALMAGVG